MWVGSVSLIGGDPVVVVEEREGQFMSRRLVTQEDKFHVVKPDVQD